MFVEILVTMGIVGLLAYINIFIASLFSLFEEIVKNNDLVIYGARFYTGNYCVYNPQLFLSLIPRLILLSSLRLWDLCHI